MCRSTTQSTTVGAWTIRVSHPSTSAVAADPDAVVIALGKGIEAHATKAASVPCSRQLPARHSSDPLTVEHLAFCAARGTGRPRCLAAAPAAVVERHLVAVPASARFHRQRRRGGVGGGPGISVGAALALKGSGPAARRRSAATATS